MHVARADLHLEGLALRADHRGVDRAVLVVLRCGDVIVEFARDVVPQPMHHAERGVAVGDRLDHDAYRAYVEQLLERELLALHLAPDAVDVLGPAVDRGGRDAGLGAAPAAAAHRHRQCSARGPRAARPARGRCGGRRQAPGSETTDPRAPTSGSRRRADWRAAPGFRASPAPVAAARARTAHRARGAAAPAARPGAPPPDVGRLPPPAASCAAPRPAARSGAGRRTSRLADAAARAARARWPRARSSLRDALRSGGCRAPGLNAAPSAAAYRRPGRHPGSARPRPARPRYRSRARSERRQARRAPRARRRAARRSRAMRGSRFPCCVAGVFRLSFKVWPATASALEDMHS